MELNHIYNGDCLDVLKTFPDDCINCCVTSPPYYGLRDYGVDGQIGNENSPDEYVNKLTEVFTEVKRVLKHDGTLWLNIADSWAGSNQGAGTKNPTAKQASNHGTNYMTKANHVSKLKHIKGCKPKDLIGIPWMVAFALRESGWYLRQDIIWAKGNPMPESVRDRCTKSHEYIFLLSKNRKYYYDYQSIKEPTVSDKNVLRNKRDVWNINTKPCKEAHFATFPDSLIEPCILAGCVEGGVVLDPFMGSGTTGMVAKKYGRNYIGIELNKEYIGIANKRIEEYMKK